MVSTAKKDSRKTKRAQAARERAREAHARLVIERQGDPRYVHQTHTSTGRTIQLRPDDVDVLRRQQELFVEKFGREPGPDDPLFFDPNKDVPTEIDAASFFSEVRTATELAGVDPAFVDAWEEVGYLITEQNQHLFSAHDVEAFNDAVHRARAQTERALPGDGATVRDATAVIDIGPEQLASARRAVINRLGLDSDAAIEHTRERLAASLGQVITMVAEDGEHIAQITAIQTSVHPPYPSGSLDEHVADVMVSLREEALIWMDKLAGHEHHDPAATPGLADYVLLCTDQELAHWVRQQMQVT